MDKLELAKYLLEEVGMPPKQQSTLCCLALLAMAKLTKDTPCRQASNDWIRIHDIIAFIGEHYGVIYAENSRETFRKQAMHAFRTAALIEIMVKLLIVQIIVIVLQMNSCVSSKT